MCRASFTNSSCPLLWFSTVVSSQWIGWWFSHASSTSPLSPSHRHVPSVLSPVSVWSLRCRPGRSCRWYDTPHWIVIYWIGLLSVFGFAGKNWSWTHSNEGTAGIFSGYFFANQSTINSQRCRRDTAKACVSCHLQLVKIHQNRPAVHLQKHLESHLLGTNQGQYLHHPSQQ